MNETTSDPNEFNSDEGLNTLTHFLGFLLAVGGVPVLITLAAIMGTQREIVTFSIFGAALIFTYMSSTLYHYVQPGMLKRYLRRLDHLSIYLLIAGTYTPFVLVGLGGAWGWSLFGVLWALAAIGIVAKLGFGHRFDVISVVAYVLMGWIGLVAIVPLVRDLPTPSLILVLAGGLSYTIGAVFYALEKLRFNHAIWHLFCLGGSVLQFIAVFFLLGR
ncbi:MAG TPA: hemolysin III family protein [Gammaproteobacteria bacterium]|nr:hemolysin III family protein [Gammaproteobacteria bacterium]